MCGFHHQRHHEGADRSAEQTGGDVMTMAASRSGGEYRVSAAERDAVIEKLREHTGAGRLTLDEFGERTEEALAARTRSELTQVLRELPRLPTPSRAGRPTVDRGWARSRSLPLPVLLFAFLAVAAVAIGHWWVILPLLWFGGGLLRPDHHRRERADTTV